MKRSKKWVALTLCLVILFSSCTFFTGAGAANLNQQKNELTNQLASQKEEQKRLAALLEEAKKERDNQLRVIELLYDEMNSCQDQLNTVVSLISEYNALAAKKEEEIDELNARIDKNFELFKERLVFAQESGNMSYIDFLLGSSDLSDIISRTEVVQDMLDYDKAIIDSLIADRAAVEKAKEEIDNAVKACEDKKAEYEALVATLTEKKAEADALLAELESKEDEAQKALNIIAAAKKKTEEELDEINKQIAAQSANKPGPTGFIWPLPTTSPGYISQYFHSGHSGLDIAVGGWVNNGKIPAVAIASGTVVRVGSYWDWGNLVVVDHGGGYLSYYAHLDSFSVSMGQKVSIGQQVGKIGSTGQSTGPHLHLVIYAPVGANGTSIRTDPMKYINYPG
ncbi:MAG: peptidoglycan DD-metalloendopeptidase family protein [Clostridia bacterium]|nr:peptidoglycan DD-metalloendopeptidase family protein [Clostridia bacterium]